MAAQASTTPPFTKREIAIEKEMIRLITEKASKKDNSNIKGFTLLPIDIKNKLNFRASEKAISTVAAKSLNFNIGDLGAIESNFTYATIKYSVDGAQRIFIDGYERSNPSGTAVKARLFGYGYFFELTIVSDRQWTFSASSIIVDDDGSNRSVANPPISGFGDFKGQIETV